MLSLSIFLPIILLSTPDTNSINAYKRDSSSSATILFEEKALDTKENDNYSSNILEADSTSGMLTRVENDINSIGYAGLLSVYDYNNDKMLSDELSMLALNGISPTKENIENEEYGLVRQNNIFLKMEKQDFIQIENDIENGTIVSNDEEVLA
ncbi:MAG: hypothetical protein DRP42_01250 [Tenericutes bacterium]|nr:MAG: hypothetical protein DRP42_01250 [Mycoplasmatota bacterium]